MDIFRYLLTIILFIAGVFCLVQFLLENFNLLFLALSLVCFVFAYWVKPKRENHDRGNDAWYWFDFIDMSVEAVYWIIKLPFRLLRRVFDFFSPDIP
ncbi:hypothetical protein MMP66_05220 [Acinetobacter dispersus]|uniref:hypothetical protein n=1 Tax=Acinetobacter dispersus TaxID=70348 RepID=UPI001F4B9CAD|nr:hypothetical protein [Acinetobacter dispersus]MCH7393683.1 hypothetical protein [Acinetobacter dispersus]